VSGRAIFATGRATHYGGGLIVGSTTWASGWPCCCSGRRAEAIRANDNLTADRAEVDCEACLRQLRRRDTLEAPAAPRPPRVIDALRSADVLEGRKWIALPLPGGVVLPTMTVGVDPERGKMYWCDGVRHPGALRQTCFGQEALLTFGQLFGECTLVDPEPPAPPRAPPSPADPSGE